MPQEDICDDSDVDGDFRSVSDSHPWALFCCIMAFFLNAGEDCLLMLEQTL